MKPIAVTLIAIGLLSGCETYTPSQANCFSFTSQNPTEPSCAFEPLNGKSLTQAWIE